MSVAGGDAPAMTMAEATRALTAPGELFEMEVCTIRGVPTRTWRNAPASLRTVLDLSLGYGDLPFLVLGEERTSFATHYRSACTLAHRLGSTFGVCPGDRVAIAMRNLPEWVMSFWAVTIAGAVVVPLNAWWTGEELRYALEDSGSVVALVDTERAGRIRPFLKELTGLRTVIVTDEHRRGTGGVSTHPEAVAPGARVDRWTFTEALGDVDPTAAPPDIDIDPDDDATIFYTSGTTGRPMGAIGTHRNICTNLMSLFFLDSCATLREGVSLAPGGDAPQSAFLLSVPLFHATGCHSVMLASLAAGRRIVMMHHFDPERALELIEKEHVTAMGGVPSMVLQILDSPRFATSDTSSVRGVTYGGAPAPPDLVRRVRAAWPGCQPSNGYGLTETSAVTSLNTGRDYLAKPGSVGPPVPVCDVAVVPAGFTGTEPEHTRPLPPGVEGELWIKGPNVVRGYWNHPEETSRTFTRGWLHTGDVARLDDEGYIFIVDRAKDVIIRGGENVYPVQVEAALFEHPAVADCAVIGVPHPILGEEVEAIVALRPGAKVSADELARHVGTRHAAFMVPTRFCFRTEALPRNPQGKVLKRELRGSRGV